MADPNWFTEHTYLESQYPVDPKEPKQKSDLPSVVAKGVYKHPPEALRSQTPKVAAESVSPQAKHKNPPIIPGVNPPIGVSKAVKPPPPPPARDPPSNPSAGGAASGSRPDPPELPGAAKSAPNVDRSRRRTQNLDPNRVDYSCLLELDRPGYGVHYAFDVVGGIDASRITIGLDWHKVISPWGVDKYNYPSPLFVTQLRELAEEFGIQYRVVSFTGWSGAQAARDDISTFVAVCVSVHGLPFCGFRVTKAPIGFQGKAAIIPELYIQIFVDDRSDVINEVKKTGAITFLANGQSTVWANELLHYFTTHDRDDSRP